MGARVQDPKSIDVDRLDVPLRAPGRDAVVVGSVNDPAEADADRLAERALSLAGSYEGANLSAASSGSVRRSASADVDGLAVDSSALVGARSGGTALDGDVRAKLEHGFGADLGAVRVHTGSAAAGIARQISARAFTHGNDVYFGAGEYRPGTAGGDHVLAHEVAHTVQNGGADGVHRFPATWSTSPVPWGPMTASVYRPGEGASGGVYILTSKNGTGPVEKAVVKPVSGKNGLDLVESGAQLQFSDVALGKLFGLNAPTSKVVARGGSEFADLVALCKTKQPPPKPLVVGQNPEPGLSEAQSFVVMSEVPNASSIASLADKAPNNKQASGDLFHAVFDSTFLAELGKLCIGDLMLGNPDRMVLGAMNLGNVMVSMQDGRARLAAIDTTAYLPRAVPPEKWVSKAGMAGGGFISTKSEMKGGPGPVLDGFFETLVSRLKKATPPNSGPMPAWQVIETTYSNHRDRFLADFDYGWNDAMITALALSEDDGAIDSITSGYDDDEVTGTTLKANLAYLGAQAEGKSHEQSIGRSIAITASGWVSAIDHNRMTPPRSDELAARAVDQPSGKAVTAEVVSMPRLPTSKNLKQVTRTGGPPLRQEDYESLARFPGRISEAHAEVDNAVSATKQRRSRPFGSKEDVPRNRSVVSHYIVNTMAMGAGGARAADAAAFIASIAQQTTPLLQGDYRGNEASAVKTLFGKLASSVPELAVTIAAYKRQLAGATTVVPKTRHGDGQGLVTAVNAVTACLDKAIEGLAQVKKMDLQKALSQLKVSSK